VRARFVPSAPVREARGSFLFAGPISASSLFFPFDPLSHGGGPEDALPPLSGFAFLFSTRPRF